MADGDELPKLTPRMRSILEVLIRANRDGSWVDMDQLLTRTNYQVSKQAIQFTVRNMVEKGVIAKGKPQLRRGRKRLILIPTALGYELIRRGERNDPYTASGLSEILREVEDLL